MRQTLIVHNEHLACAQRAHCAHCTTVCDAYIAWIICNVSVDNHVATRDLPKIQRRRYVVSVAMCQIPEQQLGELGAIHICHYELLNRKQ